MKKVCIIFSLLLLTACGTSDDVIVDENATVGSSGSSTSSSSSSGAACNTSSADIVTKWIMNTTVQAAIIASNSGGVLVNVQSVQQCGDAVTVQATGIPDYEFLITQDQIDWLNARPRATPAGPNNDFATGTTTTATAGNTIRFGEDINLRSDSMDTTCGASEGYGYWPPGPTCPSNQSKNSDFPLTPTDNSGDCATGGGPIGYAVNGTSIYNWTDGQSYDGTDMDTQGDGVWQTLAPFAEVYDVDLCGGHAASGDYHHHFYSPCWADVAGEDTSVSRTGHSVIFGFAADGYPVYGPWHNTGVLAQSCWKIRDYSNVSAGTTGCAGGTPGERTCVLEDEFSSGTVNAPVTAGQEGPTTSGSFTNLSQNVFTTVAGFFYQDYYFDTTCPAMAEQNLDAYNGHNHDSLGYHYHLSVTDVGATLTSNFPYDLKPVFPFTFGPNFRGNLPSTNAVTNCGGAMGGGGGMPPPPT